MPILEVEIVVDDQERLSQDLARWLADAAGQVLGSPAGRTWVRVRELPQDRYAENGGGPPVGVRPVFVTVLRADRPAREELRKEIEQLTREIARVCDRPAESVHVQYAPEGRGWVAFGGRLVE